MAQVAFACRSLGYTCEWALRAGSPQEILERVRDHARCAHNLQELTPDTVHRVEQAIHPA
jgi:predicted small metal-binding protein